MPKELTHFTIARQVLELMESSWIKESLQKYICLYYIGAVAFDTPYYLRGRYRPYFQTLAAYLHGTGKENTFQPIKGLFNSYRDEVPEYLLPFIYGLFTHIVIDAEFHPLIYSLTGDYYDADQGRRIKAICSHREWEANLDIYFSHHFRDIETNFLEKCLLGKNISDSQLYELMASLFFGRKENLSQIKKALASQAGFLKRMNKRTAYLTLLTANFLASGRLNPTLALFYRPTYSTEYFEQSFSYLHPGDGLERSETVDQIRERAVYRCLALFSGWSHCSSPVEIGGIIARQNGPSLEDGLYY